MEKVLLFTVTALGLCTISSKAAHHYHFVYDVKSWTDALSYCREKYTDLATIENTEDVTTLNNMAKLSKGLTSNLVWIGLYDDINGWKWSMSDSDFYNNREAEFRRWSSGQPDNYRSREHCVGMYSDGLWYDIPCEVLKWVVCFDVRGPNVTFVFINNSMNWSEAQSYCRSNHTDLASVRNMAENQRVKEMIPAGQTAWIGLFRVPWTWTDGSKSSFTNWNLELKQPNNNGKENCAAVYFGSSGKWEDWGCEFKMPSVCYSVPIFKKVVRLRLESTTNLDDDAVKEEMLKQLKQKVEEKGIINLSWRKQSDGKVFHKEKEEKKRDTSCTKDEL